MDGESYLPTVQPTTELRTNRTENDKYDVQYLVVYLHNTMCKQ